MTDKFCKGGGCGAKLGAGLLEKILKQIEQKKDENLIAGFDGNEDAAVYRLTDDLAVVQTLDFFPPMVEDPYTFGQIAAANSVSDIYAMGGEVKTALNIVCFNDKMDINILGEILEGGADKVREAGGVLAGGHSIVDESVKYGLSVMGTVDPNKMLRNNSCRDGDYLILTKPLGVGIITTAGLVGLASEEATNEAISSMTTLNKRASEIAVKYGVHACTDVTGFGLLGHLKEMLHGEMSAEIYTENIPYIKQAYSLAEDFIITAAGQKNRNFVGDAVEFENTAYAMEEILFDPQTSGGLLLAVGKDNYRECFNEIEQLGLPCGIIGKVCKNERSIITVK